MRQFSLFLCLLMVVSVLLPGCGAETPATEPDGPKPAAQVGQLPEALRAVVSENRFHGAAASGGRVLKAELCAEDPEKHCVQMMDLYGSELGCCTLAARDACHITTLTATSDGGFLFVLGFRDHALDQDRWASDGGFASEIVKCDAAGVIQFDTKLPQVEGDALEYCFERDGKFYFFGTIQTPDTKIRGVYSPSDIFMAVLDGSGELLDKRIIAGSDFDDLNAAEPTGDGFLLSVRSQSEDGDFTGSGSGGYPVDWTICVNAELEVISQEKGPGRSALDRRLGELGGETIYTSSPLLEDFDAGRPTAVLDYDDFYVIVSENITGIYQNTPAYISSIWHYTETVYSGYAPDGELLFRAAVDSTPDYDARLEALGNE